MESLELDIPKTIDELIDLYLSIDLQVTCKGDKPTSLEYYRHQFMIKILIHIFSLKTLYFGYNHKGRAVKDYSGVLVITRSILEAFLLFYFIFYEPSDPGEKELRFLLWEREGLVTRQHFDAQTEETRSKQKDECISLIDICEKIEASKYFEPYKKKFKLNIGKYKNLGSWHPTFRSLIDHAKFREYPKNILYSHLSSHAHTEYNNLLQSSAMLRETDGDGPFDQSYYMVFSICYTFIFYFIFGTETQYKLTVDEILNIKKWKSVLIEELD